MTNEIRHNNFYIITGGPGSGKSTLLNALRAKGFDCVDEVARQIIIEQTLMNGDALHTKNQAKFCDLMLSHSIATFDLMTENIKPVFFDRGIPDLLGYCNLTGIATPDHLIQATQRYRYNKTVFITPPWQDIYVHDDERKQSWEEAVSTYQCIKTGYIECGYELVELPKVSVDQRVDFILTNINHES